MKFTRVIGKMDPNLVMRAEEKLSKVILELAINYTNKSIGLQIGGDPLVFTLMQPMQHICTNNIPTAATDGKRFYWNPEFLLKKSLFGLRLIAGHEAWHSLYMHPIRRGSRNPQLWNIAVDYIVNYNVMEDLKARGCSSEELFKKHLGSYKTVEDFADMLRDPFKARAAGNDVLTPVKMPKPDSTLPLSPEQKKYLEEASKRVAFFYADPNLLKDWQSPERLYNYFYSLIPKCPDCGKFGMYTKPKKGKKDKKDGDKGDKSKDKEKGDGDQPDDQSDNGDQKGDQGDGGQDPSDQSGSGCGHKGCGTCGGDGDSIDVFGFGGLVDDHMDSEETEEKTAGRIAEAMESARKMAGHIPAALEDELGKLTAPKISWKDYVRTRQLKRRNGNTKNDWTRFRTRPMFAGILSPKKISFTSDIVILVDTSGSMSRDDIAFGVSQLASLDDRDELTVVCGDATIYWDQATKLRKVDQEEIKKIKIVGRGGTMYASFFDDYKKELGIEPDMLIIITDGYLDMQDIANMKNPGVDVFWILTADSGFNAPFGYVFNLRDM